MLERKQIDQFIEYCQKSKNDLKRLAKAKNKNVQVVLHWTGNEYDKPYRDYHVNIFKDGTLFFPLRDFAVLTSHNDVKSQGSVAIALTCGKDATLEKSGKFPPTKIQLNSMAVLMAIASYIFKIPINVHYFPSHGESADNDDYVVKFSNYQTGFPNNTYGPKSDSQCWDLLTFWNKDLPKADPFNPMTRGETLIRDRALWYRNLYYKY